MCNTGESSISDKVCAPESTVVGYMGGTGEYPNYQNYTMGNNYSETLRLLYDPAVTSYKDMLDHYWTYAGGSATYPSDDPAYQFRLFFNGRAQQQQATAALASWTKTANAKLYIDILDAEAYTFWKAEEYHQKYDWQYGDPCGQASVVKTAAMHAASRVRLRL